MILNRVVLIKKKVWKSLQKTALSSQKKNNKKKKIIEMTFKKKCEVLPFIVDLTL